MDSMITQLVPSPTSLAHLPAVPARIAVPSVELACGATFDEALTTVWFAMVLIVTTRPAVPVPSVIVHVPPALTVMKLSVAPSVSVVAVVLLGAVVVTLLVTDKLVALATPSDGVTSVGLVANTKAPVPVAPVDVTPSTTGWPLIVGALMVGLVPNTKAPVPVAPVEVTPSTVTWLVIVTEDPPSVVAPVVVLNVPLEPDRSKLPLALVAPLITGAVSVLLVNVCDPVKVVVGSLPPEAISPSACIPAHPVTVFAGRATGALP